MTQIIGDEHSKDLQIQLHKGIWVDPPSGWQYDFPKIWNGEGDFNEWLVKNGYPKKIIEEMGEHFYVRSWYAVEEEITKFGIS